MLSVGDKVQVLSDKCDYYYYGSTGTIISLSPGFISTVYSVELDEHETIVSVVHEDTKVIGDSRGIPDPFDDAPPSTPPENPRADTASALMRWREERQRADGFRNAFLRERDRADAAEESSERLASELAELKAALRTLGA